MSDIAVNEWGTRRDREESRVIKVRAVHGLGAGWFGGWMFTIGFAKLIWWKALLGLVVWPFFLGLALR